MFVRIWSFVGCVDAESGSIGAATTNTVSRNVSIRNNLFIPSDFPTFAGRSFGGLYSVSCVSETGCILGNFLGSFSSSRVSCYMGNTCANSFSGRRPTPVSLLNRGTGVLRL